STEGVGPAPRFRTNQDEEKSSTDSRGKFYVGTPDSGWGHFFTFGPSRTHHGKKSEAPAPARWWRGAVKRAARVSEALRGPPSTKQYVAGLRRQVPLQEGARPVDGTGLQLRRIPPPKH